MSGGSYDYVCFKIQDIILEKTEHNPRRAAFQKLLKLVGRAMHDIEWVDSCDMGDGDENEAIDACFSFLTENPQTIIKAAAYDKLGDMIKKFFSMAESK